MKPGAAPPSDPLVDEIRAIRAKISAEFGNDVGKLCDHLREVEGRYAGRVVQGPTQIRDPQRTTPVHDSADR